MEILLVEKFLNPINLYKGLKGMEKFADVLKDLIDGTGMTVRQVSLDSGISAVQLLRYLNDGALPTIKVAVKIAEYFDCSLDYLFGLTDINKRSKSGSYDHSKFIERYLKALKDNNITHFKFCQFAGLSESTLRHWEYGEMPKIETLIMIVKMFSLSLDYLTGRDS